LSVFVDAGVTLESVTDLLPKGLTFVVSVFVSVKVLFDASSKPVATTVIFNSPL